MIVSKVTGQDLKFSVIDTVRNVAGCAETFPEFPGGEKELYCFIESVINKDLLITIDTTGIAYAQFVVDTSGNIKEIMIVRPLNPVADNELLRVLGLMPKWRPGKIYEKPVAVKITLPLKIPYKNLFNCN